MRPVKGFERSAVQWAFVTLAILLIVVVAALSVTAWRLTRTVRELRAARTEDQSARDQLERRLLRERAAREAVALELGRVREGARSAANQLPPTLTLEPSRRREPTPPPPTMAAPAPTQIIELRLVLPPGAHRTRTPYQVTVRDWVTGQVRLARAGLASSPLDAGGHAVKAYVAGEVFAAGSHEVIVRNDDREIATYELTVK